MLAHICIQTLVTFLFEHRSAVKVINNTIKKNNNINNSEV